jgi:hypothetical protein
MRRTSATARGSGDGDARGARSRGGDDASNRAREERCAGGGLD